MAQLLKIRGFLPFLLIMFINASVDLAHKITIQNVLIKSFDGNTLVILVAIINAMILLPFIFLFSPAGFINDKFSKTTVIRYAALTAIALTLLILFAYYQGWFIFAFAMTFLLAVQSAFYSPAKYGLIKRFAGVEKLSLANGVIQALTIIAILLSSFIFSAIFEKYYMQGVTDPNTILSHMSPIGILLVILSSLEAFFAFKIPFFSTEGIKEKFDFKEYFKLKYLRANLKILTSNKDIWLSIIGLSIFWGISQMVIAAFPAHYKMITQDNNAVIIQGILAVSAIGLISGSIIAGVYSKRHIELGIIPIGALGMFAAICGMTFAQHAFSMGIFSLIFGFFGGLFIVPLNSIIQYFSSDSQMGKILAGNNFVQNCSMVSFLILTVVFVLFDFSTTQLFSMTALIAFLGALFAIKQVPHLFARILLFPILKLGYKTSIQGIENIPPHGGALLLGNHISWIDWLILQVASPRALKFVMFRAYYDKWYLTWIFKFFDVIPIAGGASKSAIEGIRARLKNGEVVALFPEGIISYNGQIGKFERGFELAIEGIDVPIVPFYLRGLWGSTFSRADDYYKQLRQTSGKREIMIAFGEALKPTAKTNEVKQAVIKLSLASWDFYLSNQKPLHYHWLKRANSHLFSMSVIDHATGAKMNNLKLLSSVVLFIKKLKGILRDEENIGVLLPSSAVSAIVNLALFALGKKAVNLNYTLSAQNLQSAIELGGLNSIITSKTFEKKLEARGFNFHEILDGKAIYAESLRESVTKTDIIKTFFKVLLFPTWLLEFLYFERINIDDTAVILFSSGSENMPKGVELTHKNLLANIKQVADLLNFRKDDVVLNSLPAFHSFGLTITTLMPLCEGILTICIADPTDVASIGKMCVQYRASILLGTSTFFRLYVKNRKLHPLMLQSVRIAVAGAEKLKEDVKNGFKIKFGINIYEGYGTTETAPVVCVNMPDTLEYATYKPLTFHKEGTVGMPLPGTIVKIVDPETLQELPTSEDGLILIGGSQVMKGYYKNEEKTNEAIVKIGDWRYYKSGDKGHMDEDGFVTIVDRYSRFAKIGGEMISLTSVESLITALFKSEIDLTAVALTDSKKGEKIILLFTGELSLEEFLQTVKNAAIAPLLMPSEFYKVDVLPKLASGKADFKASKELALRLSCTEEKSGNEED
ncbi:MAG: acyl-[ACP]--phospholipid O-acyltransferase [Campylobacteraceae bacterium]|jgi:acyl-[acyl-carrier-protein]-phospholipid O-acyltransferase/long-chain-fatty-acid--[acyl-carrier-protein] ligase|nr:acyl-[ACP]--phospholipid O-acyltransferase [Campylobacteraceae bacterium]